MNQQIITMSERGLSPYANQDAVFYKLHHAAKFFALADGMGGYNAGDVASHLTIETVYDVLRDHLDIVNDVAVLSQVVETAVQAANTAVYDSRLMQLTVDHSLVEHFVQQGIISEAERFSNINNHIVTRGIGSQPDVEVDIFLVPLQENDQFLLCSDGLWGAFPDSDVVAILLAQDSEMPEIGQQLIQAAIDAGSNDHISLVWAKLEPI